MQRIISTIFLIVSFVTFTGGDVYSARVQTWANKSNWIVNLQHVYVCYKYSGRNYCYANPGSNTGGIYLTGTVGYGNNSKIVCASGGRCTIRWGRNGTCHQGANRMLRTVGTTVYAAGGYSISARLYGTYGTDWLTCSRACSI